MGGERSKAKAAADYPKNALAKYAGVTVMRLERVEVLVQASRAIRLPKLGGTIAGESARACRPDPRCWFSMPWARSRVVISLVGQWAPLQRHYECRRGVCQFALRQPFCWSDLSVYHLHVAVILRLRARSPTGLNPMPWTRIGNKSGILMPSTSPKLLTLLPRQGLLEPRSIYILPVSDVAAYLPSS